MRRLSPARSGGRKATISVRWVWATYRSTSAISAPARSMARPFLRYAARGGGRACRCCQRLCPSRHRGWLSGADRRRQGLRYGDDDRDTLLFGRCARPPCRGSRRSRARRLGGDQFAAKYRALGRDQAAVRHQPDGVRGAPSRSPASGDRSGDQCGHQGRACGQGKGRRDASRGMGTSTRRASLRQTHKRRSPGRWRRLAAPRAPLSP